jgi:hypothetical protein
VAHFGLDMIEFITEFFSFALNMLFWYIVSSVVLHLLLRRTERRAEELSDILHRVNEVVHRVRVEEHYNNFYWYDADSDKFLAQGATPAELIDRLKVRFPQHIFLLESNDTDTVLKLSAPNWKIEKLSTD